MYVVGLYGSIKLNSKRFFLRKQIKKNSLDLNFNSIVLTNIDYNNTISGFLFITSTKSDPIACILFIEYGDATT